LKELERLHDGDKSTVVKLPCLWNVVLHTILTAIHCS